MDFFSPTNFKRSVFFIVIDIIVTCFAIYLAFLLRFDFYIQKQYFQDIRDMFIILTAIKVIIFYFGSVYKISWRHFSFRDSVLIVYYSIFATFIFTIIVYMFRDGFLAGFPRSVIPIEFFISLSFVLSFRIVKRFYLEVFNKSALGTPTLVVASLEKASEITRKMQQDGLYWPVAIYDNHSSGIRVNGVLSKSIKQLKEYHIGMQQAIVSDEFDIEKMYETLKSLGIKEFKKYNSSGGIEKDFKEVSIEDLLARHPRDLDKNTIEYFIKNKIIAISGAGGSIGSEIARQCQKYGAKKLILIDHSEFNLYNITEEIEPSLCVSVLQNILHKDLLEKTFQKYTPDIFIHAAAYKHVPLVEANIDEAIQNNIIGTKNCVDLAVKYSVEKFIMISTDKAVRPTNVMGATKRVCELYVQNKQSEVLQDKKTEIVAVRFGNVLGSSGSVIPKFKKQIQNGGPITVTHPDITRYFMLISEACELVLQAGAIGEGGEIFILDMGEPVKIVELAKKMIELSGQDNIDIVFTGLRPGEKLYEELLIDESDTNTKYESITIAKPTQYDIRKLNKDIEELMLCDDKITKLKDIVIEFNHQP